MKKLLTILFSILALASVAHAQVIPCAAGFTSSGSPCGIGGTPFWTSSPSGLSGSRAIFIANGAPHDGTGMFYQTAVNVQAFTSTFTFVPNGQNLAFVLSRATSQGGPNQLSSGAGCESGFFQAFNSPPIDNVVALEFDSWSYLTTTPSFSYSSVQLYQMNQSPCNPDDSSPGGVYYLTNKISTSPVPLNSPATTQGTSTGHVYSATVIYDGSNYTLNLFDVTAGGSCPGSTCFTHTWNNVNVPSLVGSNTAYAGFTGGIGDTSTYPLYIDGMSYTVNTPPANPSFSSYTPALGAAIVAAAPTFTPAAGTYSGTQSVTISTTTPNSYIVYSTSTSIPALLPSCNNHGGAILSQPGSGTIAQVYTTPITISSTQNLYAMACLANTSSSNRGLASPLTPGTYTIGGTPTVANPIITPVTGTYSTPQTVAITDATPSAVICYTTDGSTPTATSPGTCSHGTTYSGSFTVSSTQTINAIGTLASYLNSSVSSVALTITFPTLTSPSFTPGGGSYVGPITVVLSYPAGSNACVGINTTPTAPTAGTCGSGGTLYTSPITVSGPETINAISTQVAHINSPVASATYAIAVATPTFSPGGGTYTSAQTVSILDATPGATIYYTTDGSTPTTGSTVYTAPLTVGATQTIKALAAAAGLTNSAVGTAVYTINLPVVATPTFTPPAGTYVTSQTVTIATTTPSSTIYYTVDGTTPTTSSTVYSAPITVASSQTVKAIAVASGFSNSPVGSASYVISSIPTLAAPTFSPVAGAYVGPQTITLNLPAGSTGCYTLGSGTPFGILGVCQSGSTTYTVPIVLSGTNTINALATQTGFSNSSVASATYTLTVATPTFSPGTGTYSGAQVVTISSATAGASIYFTADGTTPTPSSTPYTGPVVVASSGTLNAIAVLTGYTNSAIGTATYTLPATAGISVTFKGSTVTFKGNGSVK
jgi:hypothetical protein